MRENVKDVLNQARFGGLEVKMSLFFTIWPTFMLSCRWLKIIRPNVTCSMRERHLFFSSTDNRTVILTRQDFLPDRTTDSDLLFIFSSNILDFWRSLWSYLKFSSRHKDSLQFYQKSCSAHFKNSFSNVKLVSAVNCSKSSNICLIYCRSSLKHLKDINKNAISTL